MVDFKQIEGLKVSIKPKLKFDDNIIGEIAVPPMNMAGLIPIKIAGEPKLKYYKFPLCFLSQMEFIDEEKVPIEIRKEILKYRQENAWQEILSEYLEDESKINYNEELSNIQSDLDKIGESDFIGKLYKENLESAYNDFYNETSISISNQELINALECAVREFDSTVINEAKEYIYSKTVREDDFINSKGVYQLSDDIINYMNNADAASMADEIYKSKELALLEIKNTFFNSRYSENQKDSMLEELNKASDDVNKRYAHRANVDIYYPILIKLLEDNAECYPLDHPHGFEGLVHVTNASNAVEIFNDGELKSRDALVKEGRVFEDVAMEGAIAITADWVKRCTRFYYAFRTPTHFRAHYTDPVGLVFDPIIMTWENAIFVSQSAAYARGVLPFSIKEATRFSWNRVFHRGSYDPTDPSNWDLSKQRNRDFLIGGNVPIEYIKKIYFPSERVSKNINDALHGKLKGIEQEINIQKFGYEYLDW